MKEQTKLFLQSELNDLNAEIQQKQNDINSVKIARDGLIERFDKLRAEIDALNQKRIDIAFDVNQAIAVEKAVK